MVRISNGSQQLITQTHSEHFARASSEASRYLELPNDLAWSAHSLTESA